MFESYFQQASTISGRFGMISKWGGTEINLKTPTCLIHTQSGHVPHLTHSVLKLANIDNDRFAFLLPLPGL